MKNKLIAEFFISPANALDETVGGLLSSNLSLIFDSIHNLTNSPPALIGYIAVYIGEKENTLKYTFGLKRFDFFDYSCFNN